MSGPKQQRSGAVFIVTTDSPAARSGLEFNIQTTETNQIQYMENIIEGNLPAAMLTTTNKTLETIFNAKTKSNSFQKE